MAGSRRRHGRPKTAESRRVNRREASARHLDRLAQADTASLQVSAAVDYYRSALRVASSDLAEQITAEVVRQLVSGADALLAPKTRGSR